LPGVIVQGCEVEDAVASVKPGRGQGAEHKGSKARRELHGRRERTVAGSPKLEGFCPAPKRLYRSFTKLIPP
jgi:hypothetical protein